MATPGRGIARELLTGLEKKGKAGLGSVKLK
jgi:hypothetical protein